MHHDNTPPQSQRVWFVMGRCGTGHEIAGQPVAAFTSSAAAYAYVDRVFPKADPNGDPFYDTELVAIWNMAADAPDYPEPKGERT